MIALVTQHLDAIAALCRRHQVARLDLFGSAATGDFDPARSDLDFVVTYLPRDPKQVKSTFFGLINDLEDLLGRPVDVVEEEFIKDHGFRAAMEASRIPVYALEDAQALA